MPTASENEYLNTYLYTGPTDIYTNGNYYKCLLTDNNYYWDEQVIGTKINETDTNKSWPTRNTN